MVRPESRAGIVGWGVYIPKSRLRVSEIAELWGFEESVAESLGMYEKAVASPDEDSVTMGWYAAKSAVKRAGIKPEEISAVFVGSESKPYAVKPSATIIGDALGVSRKRLTTDLEFACRAGSEAIRLNVALVSSRTVRYGLAIGSDAAQANPGDILEFTASSGAAAFVIGPAEKAAAKFEEVVTYVTDTPDFWRRDLSKYPLHGEGFTGSPAYFHHIESSVRLLMEEQGLRPSDFTYAVFHQPNGKYPLKVAAKLGIPRDRVLPGLVTPWIGNTYNASALIGLAKVLERSRPGDRILVAPFGSGAGSDAMSLIVTELVEGKVNAAPTVEKLLSRKAYIDYAAYAKSRKIIWRV